MRITTIVFGLLLLPMLTFSKVNFFQGSLNQAQRAAALEGKLYFIDFYAAYCLPCKLMDQTTFMDEELGNFVAQNYVALKLNVDAFDAYEIRAKHEVKALPTVMIFSSSGKLLEAYEGSLTATALRKLLIKHNQPQNRSKTTPPTVEESYADEVESTKPQRRRNNQSTSSKPTKSTEPVMVETKPKHKPAAANVSSSKPESTKPPKKAIVTKPEATTSQIPSKPKSTFKPVQTAAAKPTKKTKVITTKPKYNKPVVTNVSPSKPINTKPSKKAIAIKKEMDTFQTSDKPISTFKPSLKPRGEIQESVNNVGEVSTQQKPVTKKTTQTTPKPKVQGLFEFSATRHPSKGYGIQIGLFAEYSNVLTEVEKIQKLFPDRKVIVHIDELNGKTVYRVAIGTFSSYAVAKNYFPKVKAEGFDGFIKNLSTLK